MPDFLEGQKQSTDPGKKLSHKLGRPKSQDTGYNRQRTCRGQQLDQFECGVRAHLVIPL
jgi:hypothetical protein